MKSEKDDRLENKILDILDEAGISADILYTIPITDNKDVIIKIRINNYDELLKDK